ncbi:MAG TPA: LD-carboxypeptidase [Alphaproteobacteria bacterium]|nr:LD-carboxypeptidase [Alphaproteobacteria bacterium]
MNKRKIKIGVVAPGSRLEPALADAVLEIARTDYPDKFEIVFHPQCFLSSGHFAGDDGARLRAFVEVANDPSVDVLWFARGGYGSCRIAEALLPQLSSAARNKIYLGYSDAGFLLAALYANGIGHQVHGPMPSDVNRAGGASAVRRALDYLVDKDESGFEPTVTGGAKTAAFNITVLSELLGTPFAPDLAGHVLMLEEVSEHMYRIDRSLFHITSNVNIRRVSGIKLGRCSDILPNTPDFAQTEEQVARHWCKTAGIKYLGRADIGHDVDNKLVPFGIFQRAEA